MKLRLFACVVVSFLFGNLESLLLYYSIVNAFPGETSLEKGRGYLSPCPVDVKSKI